MTDKDLTISKTELMPADQGTQVMELLQQGVDKGLSPEALEKLVALQERIMDRNAMADFTQAMGRFQQDCPSILKRKTVKDRSGRLLYRYAPLDDIVNQVRSLERLCGFSHSFNTAHKDNGIEVTCTVRHDGGHSENTTVFVPNTTGHNTNAAQNSGIMVQYGMRYSFIGAFGLTTADEDTDGNAQQSRPITKAQFNELQELIDIAEPDMPALCRYLGVDAIKNLPEADFDRAKAALQRKIAEADQE